MNGPSLSRRCLLAQAAAWLPLGGFGPAGAQAAYPARPIRLLVGFAAGGTPDTIARTVAQQVSRTLGQPFVIDNRAGANGMLAAEALAKAPPDGHTLLFTTASLVINASIYRKLGYDVQRDMLPVARIALGDGYLLVANPAIGADSVAALVALGKGGKSVAFASPGIGNTLHLAAETFADRTGMGLLHVPYKGAAPALNAVIGGEVQAMFIPPTTAVQQIKAGRIKALGFTGTQRWAVLPDVPTIAESVPGFEFDSGWHGVFAPAATPTPIVERLNAEFAKAVAETTVRDFLVQGGYAPASMPVAGFKQFVQSEALRYAAIVKAAKIEPE